VVTHQMVQSEESAASGMLFVEYQMCGCKLAVQHRIPQSDALGLTKTFCLHQIPGRTKIDAILSCSGHSHYLDSTNGTSSMLYNRGAFAVVFQWRKPSITMGGAHHLPSFHQLRTVLHCCWVLMRDEDQGLCNTSMYNTVEMRVKLLIVIRLHVTRRYSLHDACDAECD